MKRVLFMLILVTLAVVVYPVHAQVDDLIVLRGNQTYLLDGVNTTLRGFIISGNSSLSIKDSYIELMDAVYVVNGSGALILVNSTLNWFDGKGVRVYDDSSVDVVNSTIFEEYVIMNRTYYGQGFGLSEQSTVESCPRDTDLSLLRAGIWVKRTINPEHRRLQRRISEAYRPCTMQCQEIHHR